MRRLVLLIVLLNAPLFAADHRVPGLEKILDQHFQARGGLERILAVDDARATGKRMTAEGEMRFAWEWKRPTSIRMETTVKGHRVIQGYDGRTAWMLLPGEEEPRLLQPDVAARFDQEADFDGPLVGWREKHYDVALAGVENLNGVDCWKIEVHLPNGDRQEVLIETGSGLEMRRRTFARKGETLVEIVVDFAGYRPVDGLVLPHRTTTRVVGSDDVIGMSFERIELDVGLTGGRFVPPRPLSLDLSPR